MSEGERDGERERERARVPSNLSVKESCIECDIHSVRKSGGNSECDLHSVCKSGQLVSE